MFVLSQEKAEVKDQEFQHIIALSHDAVGRKGNLTEMYLLVTSRLERVLTVKTLGST